MGDEAASMETDEGGAEMSRALAGAKRKGMSVGHRHHYHGRGGLSQFQGAPRPSAPFFGGDGSGSGSGNGVHSYTAFPTEQQQQQHVPRHRRGGGGHLPLTDVAAERHAHHDATPGGSADGGSSSPLAISLAADPTGLQSVAPASTVAVASATSPNHGRHHHHHQSRYQPSFPFAAAYGGHRPPALGGSGLANEGAVSPLTSPTVSADSSSGSSSSSSSASAGGRVHFGGRRQEEGGDGEQEQGQQGPRMWRFEGAPLSREESTGGVFTHTSSNTKHGDGGPPNAQPRQQHHNHDRGPRKRLRLTLANDQEAEWHGFVLPPSAAVPTQFAPGTEGQDAGERMLMVAAGGLEGMHVCAAEEEEEKQGEWQVVFGEGMTTGEIIALRLQRGRQEEEERQEAAAGRTPEELPNSSSGIERFNRSNALDKVHPAAG